jgi:hypothetical protein
MPFKSEKQRKWMWANDPEMAKKWEKEEQTEAVQVNIDKILKNPKIKKLMKRLGIKTNKTEEAALKILNYLARNPHALTAVKVAFESVKEERDYKAEYKKYGSSTTSKKYRAELNQYNRKKGTYGNGDGKDASHKGGKIVGFEKESTNRGRAEKSRLKKESVNEARSTNREWNKFEKAFGDFYTTVIKLGKANTKLTGDKTDEKIFLINFTRNVGKFYSLMQSWVRGQNESVNEYDLGLTYKKGKTVKVTHKKSGKELVIVDKPNVKREYEKIGYFAEAKTQSIDGKDLLDFLMKRFKMSKSKAIATMKKHKMDMSFLKEGFGGELKGKDKDKFEKARKENAEVLGYKLTGKSDITQLKENAKVTN